MSGLRKAKQYDWKDSNLALFGSDTEKQIKKDSAKTEKAWEGIGEEVGLKIWRIVKFKVTEWPKDDYGKFYNGDSYIILNTYKEEEELKYDVHFWIGKYSTQDEYGTAAYKTVELDTFLDDKPIQHREVQGHESPMFKSYFKSIEFWQGGADTGFRHVEPKDYTPRLLHFFGNRKTIEVVDGPLCKSRLNSGDVFILDLGLKIYQWNGKTANKDEKFKAMQFLQKLKSERGGKAETETLEEEDLPQSHEFYEKLVEEEEELAGQTVVEAGKKLMRLSDASGKITFSDVKSGAVSRDDFKSEDVFLFDINTDLFVWVGKGASEAEKKNALGYAHSYLQKTSHPFASVSVLKEGQKCAGFEMALAA